jgi:glycosyltransferase involved in cell wall biosynthesis
MAEDRSSPAQLRQCKVSVAVITYNHLAFIRQAIESVLMQKTDFDFEIVVGEDGSTDGTREVVLDMHRNWPDRIHPMLREANLGMMPNILQTLRDCQGDYVAYLEGDDYWTDPHKLQKQVDFLEAHDDYVMCFHNTIYTYDDGRPDHLRHQNAWDTLSSEELILGFHDFSYPNPACAGHTSSLVFRNHLLPDYPAWLLDSISGDLPLEMLIAQHGQAKFINEAMSVHRIHRAGYTMRKRDRLAVLENRIASFESLAKTLGPGHSPALQRVLTQYRILLGDSHLTHFRWAEAFRAYGRATESRTAFSLIVTRVVTKAAAKARGVGSRILNRERASQD